MEEHRLARQHRVAAVAERVVSGDFGQFAPAAAAFMPGAGLDGDAIPLPHGHARDDRHFGEIDIADRAFATRRRSAGLEISMLPVSIPAMLKVLLVATRVTRCSWTR